MSIVPDLPPETTDTLRDKASAQGMKLLDYLALLAQNDADASDLSEDPLAGYPRVDEHNNEDVAKIRAGVERGIGDFAAGGFKTADEADTLMKARDGIPGSLQPRRAY